MGCVSILVQRKNVAALIRSFSKLTGMDGVSDVRLRICGKGPEKRSLDELTRSLGISDRVEFLSDLSEADLVKFYNSISVLANPSMHEGFGCVTLEAQRCSTPVVFFRDADIPEEVVRSAIPCDNEDDMAKKMHDLLTDAGQWEKIAREGKEYADSFGGEFSDTMVEIYRELAKKD